MRKIFFKRNSKLNRIALLNWQGTCRWKWWEMVLDRPTFRVVWVLKTTTSHKITRKMVCLCCCWLTSARSCWPFRGQGPTKERRTQGSDGRKQKNETISWEILQEFLSWSFFKVKFKFLQFQTVTLLRPIGTSVYNWKTFTETEILSKYTKVMKWGLKIHRWHIRKNYWIGSNLRLSWEEEEERSLCGSEATLPELFRQDWRVLW